MLNAMDTMRVAAKAAAQHRELPEAVGRAIRAVDVLLAGEDGYDWLGPLIAGLWAMEVAAPVWCTPCVQGGHEGEHWYPGCTCAAAGYGRQHSSHCDLRGRRLRHGLGE